MKTIIKDKSKGDKCLPSGERRHVPPFDPQIDSTKLSCGPIVPVK